MMMLQSFEHVEVKMSSIGLIADERLRINALNVLALRILKEMPTMEGQQAVVFTEEEFTLMMRGLMLGAAVSRDVGNDVQCGAFRLLHQRLMKEVKE